MTEVLRVRTSWILSDGWWLAVGRWEADGFNIDRGVNQWMVAYWEELGVELYVFKVINAMMESNRVNFVVWFEYWLQGSRRPAYCESSHLNHFRVQPTLSRYRNQTWAYSKPDKAEFEANSELHFEYPKANYEDDLRANFKFDASELRYFELYRLFAIFMVYIITTSILIWMRRI